MVPKEGQDFGDVGAGLMTHWSSFHNCQTHIYNTVYAYMYVTDNKVIHTVLTYTAQPRKCSRITTPFSSSRVGSGHT